MTDLPTDPRLVRASGATQAEMPDDQRSIGAVLSDVSKDLSTLLRQEIELAKAEAKQSVTRAGTGVGLFAGAAVAGLMFLVFLSVAGWWALGAAIGGGWSGLVVAGIWVIIALILAMVGRAQMKKINGMPETAQTVKKIPPALKGQEREGDTTTGRITQEEHR